MRGIELFNGGVALVDDCDFVMLSKYDWYLSPQGYAQRSESPIIHKGRFVLMHQVVFGRKKGMQIDHIDKNKLNNQKSNLRWVTRSQNAQNRLKKENLTSKYIGVHSLGDKWVAQIGENGKTIYLGTYKHECIAALAYNKAARKIYGENAMINVW